MTWVKLDDGLPDNPKIALLPVKARWVYIKGLCYAARYLTDGAIPTGVAVKWEGAAACRALVDAELWDEDPPAYWIHDYLEFNPSRADVEARRQADSDRKRKRNPDGIRSESLDGTGVGRVEVVGGGGAGGGGFDEFWDVYPRREGKGAARTAWDKATRKTEPAEIISGAERYRDDPNREPAYTAHPSTWLNQERWNDDPLPPRHEVNSRRASSAMALAEQLEAQGR